MAARYTRLLFQITLYFILATSALSAQDVVDVRFGSSTFDCNTNEFCTYIQIRAQADTFLIGTSSIYFNYDPAVLTYFDPNYTSETFDGSDSCIAGVAEAWDDHQIDGSSIPGVFNLTMTLNNNDWSCPVVDNDWINVGQVCFSVLNVNANPNLQFSPLNTNFNRNEPNDGSNSIPLGNLTGISGAGTDIFVCANCPTLDNATVTPANVCSSEEVVLTSVLDPALPTNVVYAWSSSEVVSTIVDPTAPTTTSNPVNTTCSPITVDYFLTITCTDDNSLIADNVLVGTVTVYPTDIDAFISTTSTDCQTSVEIDASCGAFVSVSPSTTQSGSGPGDSGTHSYTISYDYGATGLSCIQDITRLIPYTCSCNLPFTPTITVDNDTICIAGTGNPLNATFSTVDIPPTGYTYQWKLNGVNISAGTGGNDPTITTNTAGTYTLTFTDGVNCETPESNAINLVSLDCTTLCTYPDTPVISVDNNPICIAGTGSPVNANFTADVIPPPTGYTYQWQRNGVNLAGETNPTLTTGTPGDYVVYLTDGANCQTPVSNTITLTEIDCTPVCTLPPVPSIVVDNNPICDPGTGSPTVATFSTPDVPPAGYGYQWQLNGANITGGTNATLPTSTLGTYTLIFTDGAGCETDPSNAIDLTSQDCTPVCVPPTAPTITVDTNPICMPGTGTPEFATFSTADLPPTGFGYQWQFNGTNIPGATNATYQDANVGTYSLVFSDGNGCESPASNTIDLTLTDCTPVCTPPPAPTITVDANPICDAGTGTPEEATFSTADVPPTGFGYQWMLNGNNLVGGNNPTYTGSFLGTYTLIFTDGAGCDSPVSNSIDLTSEDCTPVCVPPPAPGITGTVDTICIAGTGTPETSTLSSPDVPPAGFGYQWLVGGVPIPGATNSTHVTSDPGSFTLIFTDGNGCTSPQSIVFRVDEIDCSCVPPAAPQITVDNNPICLAGTGTPEQATFSASGVISPPTGFGFQWQLNGTDITGATNSTYTTDVAGTYTLIYTDGAGCESPASNSIDLVVEDCTPVCTPPPAPTITVDANPICEPGTGSPVNATFSTADVPPTGFGYQWQLNGTNISAGTGGNDPTITTSTLGTFTLIFTDGAGCDSPVSNSIDLTSEDCTPVCTPPAAPQISVDANPICEPGTGSPVNATFSASPAPPTGFGYQWQLNGTNISAASGGNDPTITTSTLGTFTLIYTDGAGCESAVSNSIDLTSEDCTPTCTPPAAPTITVDANPICIAGTGTPEQATFSTADVPPTGFGYQWMLNGNPITGANSATYVTDVVGTYTLIFTDGAGCDSDASNLFDLVAIDCSCVPPAAPQITVDNNPICLPGTGLPIEATLSTNGGVLGFGFQWLLNGSPIAGANSIDYTTDVPGIYTLIFTDGAGCDSPPSNAIDLVAIDCTSCTPPAAPQITVDNNPICLAGTGTPEQATFSASGVISPPTGFGFQWQLNGTDITGATNSTYTTDVAGTYTLIYTDGAGCQSPASNAIDLVVQDCTPVCTPPPAPTITVDANPICEPGTGSPVNATFSTADVPPTGFGYQWQLNGTNISAGTGGNDPTITTSTLGTFTLIFTDGNGCDSPVSNSIDLTSEDCTPVCTPPAAPTITVDANPICEPGTGSPVNATFSASPAPPTGFGYQWQLNGTNISGASGGNDPTITTSTLGTFTLIYTDGAGCDSPVSNSIDLTSEDCTPVCTPPAAPTITVDANPICMPGTGTPEQATFSTADVPPLGFGYQWMLNGNPVLGGNSATYVTSTAGTYTLIFTDGAGCESDVSNSIVLTMIDCTSCTPPAAPQITVDNNPICLPGTGTPEQATFTVTGIVSPPLGFGFQWMLNGNPIVGATNDTYITDVAGTYTLIYTDGAGCNSAASNAIDLVVEDCTPVCTPPPAPTITVDANPICDPGTGSPVNATFSTADIPPTGFGYQWQLNGTNISAGTGGNDPTITTSTTGTFTLIFTDGNGCDSPVSNSIDLTSVDCTPTCQADAGSLVALTSTVCVGDQMVASHLADPTVPAGYQVIYLLTSGSGLVIEATNSTPSFTANAVENYTIHTLVYDPNTLDISTIVFGTTTAFDLESILIQGGGSICGALDMTGVGFQAEDCSCTPPTAPTITVDTNPICMPGTGNPEQATFSTADVPPLGFGYQWMLNGNPVLGGNSATYVTSTAGTYTLIFTDGAGCESDVSNSIVLTMVDCNTCNPPAAPTIVVDNNPICLAGTGTPEQATFSAPAIVSPPAGFGYQWQLNGTDIVGATNDTYTTDVAGTYTLIFTDGAGCSSAASNAIDLVVEDCTPVCTPPAAPQITVDENPICQAGTGTPEQATFSTSDVPPTGFTYQWQANGLDIVGADQSTYTTSAAGTYTLIFTDGAGCESAASNAIDLTSEDCTSCTPPAAPQITVDNNPICQAGTGTPEQATFSTADVPPTGFSYQWQFNGTDIAGATTSIHQDNVAGTYTLIFTDGAGCESAASNSIDLVVEDCTPVCTPPAAPTITVDANPICMPGTGNPEQATFSTADVPPLGFGYQWMLNGNPVLGGNTATYVTSTAGTYTLIFTDGAGCESDVSNSIVLTMVDCNTCNPPAAPTIVVDNNPICLAGTGTPEQATFSAPAIISPPAGFGYQWQLNGIDIAGATNDTYTTDVAGTYTLIFTDGAGCSSAASNAIDLVVEDCTPTCINPQAPTITVDENPICIAGTGTPEQATFSTSDLPPSGFGYQWQLNGTDITGATNDSYTTDVAGTYTLIFTDGAGCESIVSNSIDLVVEDCTPTCINPQAPTITVDENPICQAGTGNPEQATFSTSDLPPSGFGYQWQLNGSDIVGETNSTLTTSNLGAYTLIFTDGAGCESIVSNSIDLTSIDCSQACTPPVAPSITVDVNPICDAGTGIPNQATLSTSDVPPAGFNYQWYFNGIPVPAPAGGNSASFTTSNTGTYTLVFTNGVDCESATSNAIDLMSEDCTPVCVPPTAPQITVDVNPICITGTGSPSTAILSTSDVPPTGFTYQWQANGIDIVGADQANYSTSAAGIYTLIFTDGAGCESPVSNTIVLDAEDCTPVCVPPAAPTITVDANPICDAGTGTPTIATFSTSDIPPSGFSYQWQFNGTDIAGATTGSYQDAATGTYTLIFTDGAGCESVASNSIILASEDCTTCNPPAAAQITIDANPICQTGTGSPEQATLSTSDVPPTGFTYQWQLNSNDIAGATANSHTTDIAGTYTLIFTDGAGCNSAASNSIDLVVEDCTPTCISPQAPTITVDENPICIAGTGTPEQATFSTSDLPPSGFGYQWQLNGADITGATNDSYTTDVAGTYTLIFTDGAGCESLVSNTIDLVVEDCTPTCINPQAPTITVDANPICDAGTGNPEQATFSTSDVPPSGFGYQWQFNGVDIAGATTSIHQDNVVGTYTLIFTDGAGCESLASNAIDLTSVDCTTCTAPATPTITVDANPICMPGTGSPVNATFSTSDLPPTGFGYQWQLNGVNISAGTGGTNPTIITSSLGTYTLIFTDGAGCESAASNAIDLVSVDCTPVCTTPPTPTITVDANPICDAGTGSPEQATFSTSDVPPAGFTYQWQFNGFDIPAANGGDQPTYTTSNTGTYTLVFTDGVSCESIASNAIALTSIDCTTCTNPSAPSISIDSNPICQPGTGSPVVAILSTGTAVPTGFGYQWYLDGNQIPGATGQSLQANTAGTYSLVITDGSGCSSDFSNTIDLVVEDCSETCQADAGTLTTQLSAVCVGEDMIGTHVTSPTVPASYQVIYLLSSGSGLVLEASSSIADFVAPSVNIFTIHTLVYDPATLDISTIAFGTTTASDIESILVQGGGGICGSIDMIGVSFVALDCTCVPPAAPIITVDENPICLSGTGTPSFAVFSTNDTPPAGFGYQWYSAVGSPIAGANDPTYTATAPGFYYLVFVDGFGCESAESNPIELEVVDCTSCTIPATPTITASDNPVCQPGTGSPETATLSADIAPPAGFGYQWQYNGIDISGAAGGNGSTLVASTIGLYSLYFTDGAGCVSAASNEILLLTTDCSTPQCNNDVGDLEVTPTTMCFGGNIIGQFTTPPTVDSGYSIIFLVSSGNAPMVIEQMSASPLFTLNTIDTFRVHTLVYNPSTFDLSTIVIGTTTVNDINQQFIQGGGEICGAFDNQGDMVIVEDCSTPCDTLFNSFQILFETDEICQLGTGTPTTVDLSPLGASLPAGYTYQWYLNGSAIPAILGGTSEIYTATSGGVYDLVYFSDDGICDNYTSNGPVTITQVDCSVSCPQVATPTITVDNNPICTPGTGTPTTATLSSPDLPASGYTYQWQLNGFDLSGASGGNNPSITISQAGIYTLYFVDTNNNCTSAISNSIVISTQDCSNPCNAPSAPSISIDNNPICQAGTGTPVAATLSASPAPTAGFSYQWLLNGTNISAGTGGNDPTLTTSTAGVYTLVYTDGAGCQSAASNAITLAVNDCSSSCTNDLFNNLYTHTVCAGESFDLTSFDSYVGAVWTDQDDAVVTDPTNAMVMASSCTVESYTFNAVYYIIDDGGCTDTYVSTVIVTVYPGIEYNVSTSADGCQLFVMTCSNFNVTWSDGFNTGTGTTYNAPGGVAGNVTFTIIDLSTVGNGFGCESSVSFVESYNCGGEVDSSTDDNAGVDDAPTDDNTTDSTTDSTDDTGGCNCTTVYDPVCGDDGVTYGNACLADCAGVNYTLGPCSVSDDGTTDDSSDDGTTDGTDIGDCIINDAGFCEITLIDFDNGKMVEGGAEKAPMMPLDVCPYDGVFVTTSGYVSAPGYMNAYLVHTSSTNIEGSAIALGTIGAFMNDGTNPDIPLDQPLYFTSVIVPGPPMAGMDEIIFEDPCIVFGNTVEAVFMSECDDLVLDDSTDSTDDSNDDTTECICPLYYQPVCGSDGLTYYNQCFAECAGVTWTLGSCDPMDDSTDGGDGVADDVTDETATDDGADGTTDSSDDGTDGGDGTTDDSTDGTDVVDGTDDSDCNCPDNYFPVCGFNGVTYTNACYAICAGVDYYLGECGGTDVETADGTTDETDSTDDSNCNCTQEIDPVCGSDGITYPNSCWAVCAGVDYVEGQCNNNDDSTDDTECICTDEYNPVCGVDGITYGNACEAFCTGVEIAYLGECNTTDDSTDDTGECICTDEYAPVCGVDGLTYGNACEAFCAGVDVAYLGECETPFVCETPIVCTSVDEYCVDAGDAILICPDYCIAGGAVITQVSSVYQNNLIITGDCILFTPLAGVNNVTDIVTIQANSLAIDECVEVTITVDILDDCDPEPPVDCENEDISICTGHMEAVEICPDFCKFEDGTPYSIVESYSTYSCSVYPFADDCVRYTPLPGFLGADYIQLIACDYAQVVCDTVYVSITVGDCTVNNPPVAQDDDAGEVNSDESITIDITNNDSDPEGDDLMVCDFTAPANGIVELVNGEFVYTPNQGFAGSDSFSYQICDGNGGSDWANVSLTVVENCNADMSLCTAPMTAIEFCIEFCNPSVTITEFSTTFNCSLSQESAQCLRYIPLPGYLGNDVISVTACDDFGNCEEVSIDVFVGDCNNAGSEKFGINEIVDDCDLTIPNAFSPNYDGINDYWRIIDVDDCYGDATLKLTIYNTSGTAIYTYQGDVNTLNWNGETFDRSPVQSGVYYYTIQLSTESRRKMRSGFIEIRN